MTVAADEQKRAAFPKRREDDEARRRRSLRRSQVLSGGGRCSRTGAGRGPREGAGCRRVVHRFPLRAGTYLGVPKPPFTPGYELVGVVEELGPGCSRLRVGGRIAALTVWGACAEFACVLEADAVEVPRGSRPGGGRRASS